MEPTHATFDDNHYYPSAIADKIELLGEYYFQICEDDEFIANHEHTKDYIDTMRDCGNVLIKAIQIRPPMYPMVEFAYEATLEYHGFTEEQVGANWEGMRAEFYAEVINEVTVVHP